MTRKSNMRISKEYFMQLLPPSSKMPTIRHASTMAVSQWPSQEHSNVQEWGGEEERATGNGGGKRQHGDGLRGLRVAVTVGTQFQISGENPDGGGRRMAGGGEKPGKGQEELGKTTGDTQQGGSNKEGVG